jgi:hypothetical protein
VRTNQKAGQQETNDARQTDLLAQKAGYAGEKCYDGQVLNEVQFTHAILH